MTREEVIRDLIEEMSSECALFAGRYDAKHGSEQYMYGISTVMEYLASQVSEEYRDNFEKMFLKNMLDSEKNK